MHNVHFHGNMAITVSNYEHTSTQDIIYTIKNGFSIAYTVHIAFTYTQYGEITYKERND